MISIKGHRVLVKVEKLEDVDDVYKRAHQAGIHIADTEDARRQEAGLDRGTVVSIGADCFKAFYLNANPHDSDLTNFEPWCQVGDFISYAKYSGKMIEDPETKQKYIVINDEDVVAVLRR